MLGPILFNIIIKKIIKDCKVITNNNLYINDHLILAFADDIVISTKTLEE